MHKFPMDTFVQQSGAELLTRAFIQALDSGDSERISIARQEARELYPEVLESEIRNYPLSSHES